MLAVALSTASVLLIDSFNGKVVHQIQIDTVPESKLTDWSSSQEAEEQEIATRFKLAWTSHFTKASGIRAQLHQVSSDVHLDDLLGLNADIARLLKAQADLPREFVRLEVEIALPKLSTLPATAVDDDLFSTRHSVDTIFHSQNATTPQNNDRQDLVDVLLTSTRDCMVNVNIFGSFIVGKVDIARALPKGLAGKGLRHAVSHPLLSKHFLLLDAIADGPTAAASKSVSTHLVELDLKFIAQASHNLPLLATKATQLQNLLRYLLQISSQLSAEVRTAFDLPSRFIQNVTESLAEDNPTANFTTAAYHLILTGWCDDKFREWLVDQVGERGLKRWEKAVGDCLDMIRRMTSECLLPAIDRCQIVVSRLDGLSRFSDTAVRLGLDEKSIRSVREALDVLTILCEDILRDVCTEVREFAAFMRWLKWEAEVQGLGEDSERAEETRETYTGESEARVVLDYIESAMQKSRLADYIDATSGTRLAGSTESVVQDDTQLHSSFKKARASGKKVGLPKLGHLLQILKQRCDAVFTQIAETLRKSVLLSYVGELPAECDAQRLDSRIISKTNSGFSSTLHIACLEKSKPASLLYGTYDIDAGPQRANATIDHRELQVLEASKIWDVRFADDEELLLLVSKGSTREVLSHKIDGQQDEGMYGVEWDIKHTFADGQIGSGMSAGALVVNGRRDHRGFAVVDEQQMGYVVFDLDTTEEGIES